MAVKIRLRRVGRKKAPMYRIVVADSKSPRDGKFIEIVGQYQPRTGDQADQSRHRAHPPLARRRRAADRHGPLAAPQGGRAEAASRDASRAQAAGGGRPVAEQGGGSVTPRPDDDDARVHHRRAGPQGSRHPRRGRRGADHRCAGRGLRVRPSCFRGHRQRRHRAESRRAARRIELVRSTTDISSRSRRCRTATRPRRGAALLSLPADELPPPGDDEVYVHELPGMRVELADRASSSGPSRRPTSSRRGSRIDVRRATAARRETVLLQFDERTIASVDREARVIVVTPPEGLARVKINVVTIFPEFFAAPLRPEHSGARRARPGSSSTASSTCAITRTTVIARSTTIRTAAGRGW